MHDPRGGSATQTEKATTPPPPVSQAGQGVAPLLLTIPESAAALRLSRSRIYELVKAGALRSVLIGNSRRIPAGALIEFVAGLQ